MPFLNVPDLPDFNDILGRGQGTSIRGTKATDFIISEMTEDGRVNRIIVLRGRWLPHQEVPFGMEQNSARTWYQGNAVATQQILGPQLQDTPIEGAWHDRYTFLAGSNEPAVTLIGFPFLEDTPGIASTVRAFELLLKSGRQLYVEWASVGRYGILKSFVPTYIRQEDVKWEMNFEWSSENNPDVTGVTFQDVQNSASLADAFNKLNDTIAFAADTVKVVQAKLTTFIQDVGRLVGDVFDGVRAINQALRTPAVVMGSIASAVDTIRGDAQALATELGSIPYSQVSSDRSVANMLVGEAYRRDNMRALVGAAASRTGGAPIEEVGLQSAAMAVARATANAIQANQSTVDSQGGAFSQSVNNGSRRVRMASSQTLYEVSTKFYGTPDFANALADVNNLDSVLVEEGQEIIVPVRAAIESC